MLTDLDIMRKILVAIEGTQQEDRGGREVLINRMVARILSEQKEKGGVFVFTTRLLEKEASIKAVSDIQMGLFMR